MGSYLNENHHGLTEGTIIATSHIGNNKRQKKKHAIRVFGLKLVIT
jgi:hypothetical protein